MLLVAGATLALAVPFAAAAWALGGTAGLLAFVVPLLVLLAVAGATARVLRRAGAWPRCSASSSRSPHSLR